MTENTENTLSVYLGPEFQQRLVWQLLVEPEFAEKIIPDLAIEYFDDPNLKRLFIIMLEYYKEFDKVPNLQNQSIHQAINKYKTPNNLIEEESLFAVIKRITLWNERIINKQMLYDGDVVQKSANIFIKQQEYRKIAEHIQGKVKSGDIKNKNEIAIIEERFQKISHIGEENDGAKSVGEGLRNALRPEFRETIPTGIETIDVLTGGGLGKGEIGVVLTPSGVGKTTFLTKVANTAFEQHKNVAQIIFEDTDAQIQRKHSVIWADSALSKIKDDLEEIERVYQIGKAKCEELEGKGRLIIKRFSQEDTTMRDIRNWMLSYEKKWGFKFDLLVLDYLDCVESHKRGQERTEAELTVIKGFEALASDFDIPAWTAIQSNRSGFGAEFVEAHQSGGSIKRIQKAHFFMSIAKTPEQQEANFANIRILKARFAKDGQSFEDCTFNNDTMKIIIDDPRYKYTKTYKNLKHHDVEDIDKLEKTAKGLSNVMMKVGNHEATLIEKANSETINDMLRDNKAPEEVIPVQPMKTPDGTGILSTMDVVNEGAIEGATEGAIEGTNTVGLLELDENADIESLDDAVSDAVNDGVSDAVNTDLLDFSGETSTHIEESEIKVIINDSQPIVDIPVDNRIYKIINDGESSSEVKPEVDLTQFKPAGVTVIEPSAEIIEDNSIDDAMKKILETDLDKLEDNESDWRNQLIKKRDYQNVKPKE